MPEEQERQKNLQPPQHQHKQPDIEAEMTPRPEAEKPQYKGT